MFHVEQVEHGGAPTQEQGMYISVVKDGHGGQAIPAFDFYLAPYVRNSFIEEVKNLEELNGKDYSHLYQKELADYLPQPLDGLTGEDRIVQHAVNKTVSRVHQNVGER